MNLNKTVAGGTARDLAELFSQGCAKTLGRILEVSGAQLADDHRAIASYIDSLNDILKSRKLRNLTIQVNVSNSGGNVYFIGKRAVVLAQSGPTDSRIESSVEAIAKGIKGGFQKLSGGQDVDLSFESRMSVKDSDQIHELAAQAGSCIYIGIEIHSGSQQFKVFSNGLNLSATDYNDPRSRDCPPMK